MDTRFLESFLIVVEQGSISGAARQLQLTPATIAQRIRTLEHEIGCALVQRDGRNVHPTENGLAILEQSRAIITGVQDLCTIASGHAPVGKLKLGAISSAAHGLLPPYLKRFFEIFPGIELHIMPGSSSVLHNAVLDGIIDAAFIVQPPFEIPQSCVWQTLRSEPLVVIASDNIRETDPHEILSNNPFIRYDRNQWGGRLADEYLRRNGIWPHERLSSTPLMPSPSSSIREPAYPLCPTGPCHGQTAYTCARSPSPTCTLPEPGFPVPTQRPATAFDQQAAGHPPDTAARNATRGTSTCADISCSCLHRDCVCKRMSREV